MGEDPGRSVRRLPRGPGDGPRPWRFAHGQAPLVVISDAAGVVQQVFPHDMATRVQVGWGALLDAAIACAGGGPPFSEDGRALIASGRLEVCAQPDHSATGEPRPLPRGQPRSVSPTSPAVTTRERRRGWVPWNHATHRGEGTIGDARPHRFGRGRVHRTAPRAPGSASAPICADAPPV